MNILIIEDNADLAASLWNCLEAKGHVIDAAGDGVTGLHLATVNDYDVITLDLILPGLDGLELCRRLRTDALNSTPNLIVSLELRTPVAAVRTTTELVLSKLPMGRSQGRPAAERAQIAAFLRGAWAASGPPRFLAGLCGKWRRPCRQCGPTELRPAGEQERERKA